MHTLLQMEYQLETYRRQSGQVLTTTDEHKYVKRKVTETNLYLKSPLFRDGCKATAKLNKELNLMTPINIHNHDLTMYKAETFRLKAKCMAIARTSHDPSREFFDDATREDTAATSISFSECESTMYRSKRRSHPKIPETAIEFSEILPDTSFGMFYKGSGSINQHSAHIFFSARMVEMISQFSDFEFDGTFYCVTKQFFQLWTVFVTTNRLNLSAIHVLITGKDIPMSK